MSTHRTDSAQVNEPGAAWAASARRFDARGWLPYAMITCAGLACWLAAFTIWPGLDAADLALSIAGIACAAVLVTAVAGAVRQLSTKAANAGRPVTVAVPPSATIETEAAAPALPSAIAADLADLRAQRDQAQAASLAKSRFLASMSHEVRTPMTGILGMTDLLKGTDTTPEQKTYIGAIDSAARTLLRLIDELLDLSKIEAGRLHLVDQPFDLEDLIRDAVELLAPRAHEKDIEIAWEIMPGVPPVASGDAMRLRQMVLNLIGNAIKFTATGGVLVRVSADADAPETSDATAVAACDTATARTDRLGLRIAVTDTGCGLSQADIAQLFREFSQATPTAAQRGAGTGLGLAISRLLAHAMGGTITVDSTPGEGSTFAIVIPIKTVPCATDAGETIGRDAAPASVLIVSNRVIEAECLVRLLRGNGFAARTVPTAAAAGAIAEDAASIDALIVDSALPPMDASRLVKDLRARRSDGAVCAIVMIEAEDRVDLPGYQAQGLEQFVVRPVRPRSLLALLAGQGRTADRPADAQTPAASAAGAVPPMARNRRPRVLLAEDNDINALLAVSVLEKSQCLVFHAANGREAIEAFRMSLDAEPAFDLVLMDIVMPEIDGVAAAREIRSLSTAAGRRVPPIVALTANAFPEDRAHYLAEGLDDYLAKPFDSADIRRLLARWSGAVAAA